MAKKNSPEYCTFRKNYEALKSLQHGIETISSKAFAEGLISKDLRQKCSNESATELERTKWLLNALEDKILYVPTALQEFADILNDTIAFEYIGKLLLKSLEKESETRKKDESQLQSSLHLSSFENGVHAHSTTQLSEKMDPIPAMIQYRRAFTPPPKVDDYHTPPILYFPSLSAPDTHESKPASTDADAIAAVAKELHSKISHTASASEARLGETNSAEQNALKAECPQEKGAENQEYLQVTDNIDSDRFYTPRGSFAHDSLKEDFKAIVAKRNMALDNDRIEVRRGSVERLKEEVRMLKKQLSMHKEKDKETEKQLGELREEMFKEIRDLGEKLSEKMELEKLQHFNTAKFFLSSILQADPSALCQGWVEEGDVVSHTHNSSRKEFIHM